MPSSNGWRCSIRLRDGDRLVIVSAEARGEVEALPSALRKRRAQGVLTAPEKHAIAALAQAAGLSATSARFDELCAVGHAWHASADSRFDPGYQLCAEMLDGVVVEASHGGGALDVLVAGLHSDAGIATRSTLRDWWTRLDDARIPLIGSAYGFGGPPTDRRTRRQRAYREVLTRGMDVVDFSLLSDALAPLTVPDLLSTVVVSSNPDASSGHGLPDVVRRYQDLILVGHPGAGKTTAVRQLAARFASDDALLCRSWSSSPGYARRSATLTTSPWTSSSPMPSLTYPRNTARSWPTSPVANSRRDSPC